VLKTRKKVQPFLTAGARAEPQARLVSLRVRSVKVIASRPVIVAAALDLATVLIFVLIGRASHGETVLGTLTTLWPFVVGLFAGWLVTRAWRRPTQIVWPALVIWASTVIVGMILRVVSLQGIQLSFVIVATIFLGAVLLGWRVIAQVLQRRRAAIRVR
jgi:peptidoglycan/LPS O-acetylase OafA/YrhL